jgi:acyl-CoA thioesterase-2
MPDAPQAERPPPGDFEGFFALETVGEDHFRKQFIIRDAWDEAGSLFGGSILGFSVAAAAKTCVDRPLASLHMYFLRGIPYGEPVDFRVERVRDGRRVAHRQVDVVAGSKLACRVTLLFAAAAAPDHDVLFGARDMTDVPAPESLPPYAQVVISEGDEPWWESPIDWRFEGRPWDVDPLSSATHGGWVRPFRELPDDPAVHAAATAFLSDALSHWPVARVVGGQDEPGSYTSLDTAIWLHRPEPWRDWRYIESTCEVGLGGRGLSRRSLYDREGRLLASMVQEALIPTGP